MVELKIRTGYEVYEGNLKEHEMEIKGGVPFIIEVRDLTNFTRKIVKAVISKSQNSIPEGADLWFKDHEDKLILEPGSIKIIEEFADDD